MLKRFKPTTPSRRYITVANFNEISRSRPERSLLRKLHGSGGRNNQGRVTNPNIGSGAKRRYRVIDFKRDNVGVPGRVASLQYDPNRTAWIALINFKNGDKRYIIAPEGLQVGAIVESGRELDLRVGNCMPLSSIPTGQSIHNIEVKAGSGAALVRSAGLAAQLVAKEGDYVLIRLPSGETRKVLASCRASIGRVGNSEHSKIQLGKAGRSVWLGRRCKSRAVAKNPVDHPMGGGEGKTSGGRHPVSRNGIPAKGFKTRSCKRTSRFIVRRRGGVK